MVSLVEYIYGDFMVFLDSYMIGARISQKSSQIEWQVTMKNGDHGDTYLDEIEPMIPMKPVDTQYLGSVFVKMLSESM